MKAVIFDFDNTLYSYEPCHQEALNSTLNYYSKKLGKNFTQVSKEFSVARQNVKRKVSKTAQGHHRLLYFIEMLENDKIYDYKLALKLTDNYWKVYFQKMVLFEGVVSLLKLLKEREIKIVILTDQLTELQIRKLRYLKILKYIDVLITSEQLGVEKPHSNCFRAVLDKFDFKKKDFLMIGDSYEKDILGAQNFGIPFIWFNHEKLKKKKGIEMVTSFSDLFSKVISYV